MKRTGKIHLKQPKITTKLKRKEQSQITTLKKLLHTAKKESIQYTQTINSRPLANSHGSIGSLFTNHLKIYMEQQYHKVDVDLKVKTLIRRIRMLERRAGVFSKKKEKPEKVVMLNFIEKNSINYS